MTGERSTAAQLSTHLADPAQGPRREHGLAGLIDVLWPLVDRENRALHDFGVDTRTVLR